MMALQERLAALRQCGAAQLDPVHWHYLEVLARRAQSQPPQVQQLLQTRLQGLLAALQTRCTQADAHVPPQGGAAGDAPLAGLTRYLQQAAAGHAGHQAHADPAAGGGTAASAHSAQGAHLELKSVRQARSTWSRLSADKQLTQALNQAPKNAGPINSHMVVLRSLSLMRELSPDYLNRFMSYVDTLLCLDQSASERPAPSKPGSDAGADKKTRLRRPRAA